MKTFLAFVFLICFLSSSSFAHNPPSLDPQRAALEEHLTELFHKEFLMTVAGLKPFSEVRLFNPEDSQKVANLLDQARRSGLIQNNDIDWFYLSSIKKYRSDMPPVDSFIFYNKRAVEAVLKDPKKLKLLRRAGVAYAGGDVNSLIQSFKRRAVEHVFEFTTSIESIEDMTINGVLFGYPVPEIEAFIYSKTLKSPSQTDAGSFSSVEDFFTGYFAMQTLEGRKEAHLLQSAGNQIVRKYLAAVASGKSQLEILNEWDVLPTAHCHHTLSR